MQALDVRPLFQSGLPDAREQEAHIRGLTNRYMELWTSHAIEEHSQLLTEDADLVNVIGTRLHGRPAIQEHHEQLHRTIFSDSRSRILDLHVKCLNDATALVHMHWEMRGAAKLPGWNVPDPRTGWMTLVWVCRGGEWRVTSLHNTDTIPLPAQPTP